jgi:predicted nucleotidyltransferase
VLLTTGDPRLDRIVDAVVARANQTIRPERVWLFGSQAKGTAGRASDVDLAFEFPARLRDAWSAFVADTEETVPALVDLDLVDLAVCGARLAAEITSTGRLVYERGPA